MIGTLDRACRNATSWCDLDLIFDLALVTWNFKFCHGYSSECIRCRKLIHFRNLDLTLMR